MCRQRGGTNPPICRICRGLALGVGRGHHYPDFADVWIRQHGREYHLHDGFGY
jgi:hypothetical protein